LRYDEDVRRDSTFGQGGGRLGFVGISVDRSPTFQAGSGVAELGPIRIAKE
jgi:hypothetical protein